MESAKPTKAVIHQWHPGRGYDKTVPEGTDRLVVGQRTLGNRYNQIVLTSGAKDELIRATNLIRWYDQLLMRLEEGADNGGIGTILEVLA